MDKPCSHHAFGRAFSRKLTFISIACGFLLIGPRPGPGELRAAAGGEKSGAVSLTWVGYYNPANNYISANAQLHFPTPTDQRCIWLTEGLQMNSARSGAVPVMDLNHNSGQYLLQGQYASDLEINYSGRLKPADNPASVIQDAEDAASEVPLDQFRFLSYIRDYYPHAGMDFGNIVLNITVPNGWNCLGSGTLLSQRTQPSLTTYAFDNAGGKGMSLVFGHFSQIGTLAGPLPVRLHGWEYFNYEWYFPRRDMERILAFYYERFGPLDVAELNILFRRASRFGGKSYCGLIVLDVDAAWTSFSVLTRKQIRSDSPLSFFDAKIDVLSHEMAHQWWGGLISWKTPLENWITEGLATYSSLISLRAWQGEKKYRAALGKLRRQVKGCADLGAPADGYKLLLLGCDPKVYQALVYGKPALMLAALADKIGETELCARLKAILGDCRKRSLDTDEFLSRLSGGDVLLRACLENWIRAKGLPAAV